MTEINGFKGLSALIAELNVNSQTSEFAKIQIENFQLINSQAVYVVDYKKETITFQTGIKESLGYDPADFRFENLCELIHPDDRVMVCSISKAAVKNAVKLGIDFSDRLYISFRMRHMNGQYISIERTSGIHEITDSGTVFSTFSILRVPPFMLINSPVKYKWKSGHGSLSDYIKSARKGEHQILTNRELDILRFMSKGFDYAFISNRLFIEIETVMSHKKNMMRKLGLRNRNELMQYYHNLKK